MQNSPKSRSLAIYPGTFDPITNGHVDLVNRVLELFDSVIVAVAINPGKTPLFTLDERISMIQEVFREHNSRVSVESVSGLLVEYAAQKKARAVIRGLRAVSDFDYEFQLALMNRKLEREVDTVFLMPGLRWIFISSSIIKDAARHGGDVSDMVPACVNEMLKKKLAR
ncbi:pantetheine-phosphate adenylyltransferase [Desulfoprunum benzoelyticum]|uniref:Phosphopantetheine adenylyltransferase n=1 Tax=Desulfoprunum benzoelyticum TaxID=1506996 RepID=A0A840V1Z5_9BACT|nr:pantetheine-phosphate adenylyltransferase [Desulfoprunum benzoelyticum]MBB5348868.1 pantetheine-phosphate adenylyltransferase [Desulfoprunum benzoelyticum]MBM9530107.1 pantetheine-phosphate adenylyltransferase [Desulfoprunum benzoelyticum]